MGEEGEAASSSRSSPLSCPQTSAEAYSEAEKDSFLLWILPAGVLRGAAVSLSLAEPQKEEVEQPHSFPRKMAEPLPEEEASLEEEALLEEEASLEEEALLEEEASLEEEVPPS